MASPVNPEMASMVEGVLPLSGGITPLQAFELIGGDRSSPNGVRAVLRHLIDSGRCVREGEIGKYRYRRAG